MLLVPLLQTLMVCADRDGMEGYLPGGVPDSHDNGICLLLAVRPCPSLAFREDPAPEGHEHVPLIIKHVLQHGADGVVRGVCAQEEPSTWIHEVQTHCG